MTYYAKQPLSASSPCDPSAPGSLCRPLERAASTATQFTCRYTVGEYFCDLPTKLAPFPGPIWM